MTIVEAMRQAISNYIDKNGIGNIVTRQELSAMVSAIMPVESNSFLPADYCYNRTNKGISFESHIHLFELMDDGRYKILGENYMYSGPVLGRKEDGSGYEIKGVWTEGEYEEGITDIYLRLTDLHDSLTEMLKNAHVRMENTSAIISTDTDDLCSMLVMDETYKISTSVLEWKDETSYLCNQESENIVYYVETIDECLGEAKRLFDFSNSLLKGVDPHRLKIERIIDKLSKEIPGVSYIKGMVKNTPIDKNGERVLDIYYRKTAIRVNLKTDSEAYAIYKDELPKDICYQKESANPYSTNGVFAFFVDDPNVEFVLRKILEKVSGGSQGSKLRTVVKAEAFEKAYKAFIEQADKNAVSKKAQGSKIPFGFSEKPECDGAHFKAQYGQGAPSAAPYMNWWVVSIYYLPNNGNIIMGIEEDRYPHLKEMSIKPLRYDQIGNKKVNTAVFYSATKNSVNYVELYECFMSVCEEVMKLGLK
ncbi:DUF7225 domain-containing protein [Streptococcus alactolyticus]|uniref:DUF7225 domain-containing protein n=1 Tax=Streptococcus alactolyticus TaxID=29389 RepID=UPI003F9A2049